MTKKLTLDEYTQKIQCIVPDITQYRREDYQTSYAEYCKLNGRRTPDAIKVDLIRNPYFAENSNVRGCFSQFWLILSDLNKYLLKEIPNPRFFRNGSGMYTRDNALIVPRVISAAGLECAEYYLVNWVMDDSVSTWEDDFLLTPSFLKDDDEMLSFKDILGRECLDVEIIERNLRRELELRHFREKNINRFMQDLRRKICMSEIIDNTDMSSENMSVIFNNGTVRVAPLYDFDFCMGNEAVVNRHFKIKGQQGLLAVLDYYKDDKELVKWLEERILTINMNQIVSVKESTQNRGLVCKEARYVYKDFWEQQIDTIRKFLIKIQEPSTENKELE